MSKISKKKISPELRKKSIALLADKLTEAKSIDGLENFLDTMFTPTEKEVILKRCAAAVLLGEGKKYKYIVNSIEISKATISKIKHILMGDGYGRNLGKRVLSPREYKKPRRGKLFRPYKGAESII